MPTPEPACWDRCSSSRNKTGNTLALVFAAAAPELEGSLVHAALQTTAVTGLPSTSMPLQSLFVKGSRDPT